MGIWNPGIAVVNVRGLELITPHGDLELARTAITDISSVGLITPHGDLEPGRRLPASPPAASLITPHGDLELRVAKADERRNAASLPLMGIWNSRDARRQRDPNGIAHYPSWGFGTVSAELSWYAT